MTDEALHSVVVAKKTIEANNMISMELVDPAGAELPAFSAGSHIDVAIPGGIMRQYSLANSPSDRSRYIIGVWKDANSRGGSKALHQSVNVGDTLKVSEPRNNIDVPADLKHAVLMARGIGVTPMLSIAADLKAKGIPFELHYMFAGGSPDSFRAMIEASPFAENTTFYLEASATMLNPATVLAEQPEDAHLFICGVDWWLDPVIAGIEKKGWTADRIHIERFNGKAGPILMDKVFDVKIASTGAIFKIPGDKSVTSYLEEKGVKIPTACEQGACGTCKVKVLEGEVDHRDKRLKPDERAAGWFLPCVSRGKGGVLVLDL